MVTKVKNCWVARGPGVAVRGLEEDSDELKKVMDNMCRRMRAGEVESFHLEEVT